MDIKDLKICQCVVEMGRTEFESPGYRGVGITAGSPFPKVVARKDCLRCAGTGISCEPYRATAYQINESLNR